jgi:hypothetical protein
VIVRATPILMWSGGHMYLIVVLVLLHRALGSERTGPGPGGAAPGWAAGPAGEELPDETSEAGDAPERRAVTVRPGRTDA